MRPFKIGVMTDSFRRSVQEGVRKAKEVGAQGIQLYTVSGGAAPETMDAQAREEFRDLCADLGLEIAALCGDLGGHGFEREAENPCKIERSKAIVDLAADLGTSVVTTHIGAVREDRDHPFRRAQASACRELGAYATQRGVTFAIETGPETAARLAEFLAEVDSPGVGVNLDPANLVMVVADDPVSAVRTLGAHIVHTHAKDGRQLRPCDPVEVYNAFAEGGIEGLDLGTLFEETPLGEGDVDWEAYLDALEAQGFRGYLTIEREVGENPARDIANAVEFLRNKLR